MTGQPSETQKRAGVIASELGRRLRPLVVLLAAVVSLGTPSAFLALGLQALRTEARSTARFVATTVEQASDDERLWRYNAPKLLAHLEQLRALPSVQRVAIADPAGRGVPAGDDDIRVGAGSFFDLWASAPVVLGGAEVGRIWVALSAREVYAGAGHALILFTSLGLLLAGLLYWIPLRSARRSGATIDQLWLELEGSRDELARLNRELEDRVDRRSEQLAGALREIRARDANLQDVTARAISLQEAERKAIARDLHDGVGQAMTAIRLNLQILLDRIQRAGSDRGPAETALALVDEGIEELRRAVNRLGPTVLDELGLQAALHRLCDDFIERSGLEVERRLAPLELEPSPVLERTCYRIVQEALTNVVRHAAARRARIDLRLVDGHLELVIEDDGRGITAAGERPAMATGLRGIQERVLLLGGTFELDAPPGGGTRLRVRLPCSGRRPSGPGDPDPVPNGSPAGAGE